MSRIEIPRSDYGKPDALERAMARASRKTAITNAVTSERSRCAGIARLAKQYASDEAVKHAAEAIAVAIESDAI